MMEPGAMICYLPGSISLRRASFYSVQARREYQDLIPLDSILVKTAVLKPAWRGQIPRINDRQSIFGKITSKNRPYHKKNYQRQSGRIDILVNDASFQCDIRGKMLKTMIWNNVFGNCHHLIYLHTH